MKHKSQNRSNVKDYVTVAFAEDKELAQQYRDLLEENGISTQIKRQPQMAESGFSDIAIMVPEDSLDEAHALISERANYEDYFDMVLNDHDVERIDYSNFDDEDEDLY